MNYTFSGFTANMPAPAEYFSQIMGKIPPVIDQIVYRMDQPIVLTMLAIAIVLGFIFSLGD